MSDRATTRARFLALAALLLTWISGCGNDTPPLPFIRVTSLPAVSRVTTNNGRNQAITIQGTIANMPPNRPASIQIVNDLGGFPSAAPAQQLPLGTGGVFSYQIQAPLVNAMTPFLPGPDGNVVIIRAANDYSVYDSTGNPIPTTAAFTLIIDNQIVFNHPVYADLDMGDPPNVISECDLTAPMNMITGTFSVPLGTADANDVIVSAELVQRDADALFATASDTTPPYVVTIVTAADGETYTVTVNGMDYEITAGGGSSLISIAGQLASALGAEPDVSVVDNSDGSLSIFRAGGADFTLTADAQTPANIMIETTEERETITVGTDGTFSHTPGTLGGCTNSTPEDCNFFVRFTSNSPTARALLGSFNSEVTMATYPFTDCAVD